MASSFAWISDTLSGKIDAANPQLIKHMSRTAEYYSLRMETYAKSKAVWTDRTGNARNTLAGSHETTQGTDSATFTAEIAHGMPYGIWLEIRFAQRFAIINKTVDAHKQEFMDTAKQVMKRLGA